MTEEYFREMLKKTLRLEIGVKHQWGKPYLEINLHLKDDESGYKEPLSIERVFLEDLKVEE